MIRRGFAFAWFQIAGANIGLYSMHLKSNLIIRGDKEKEAAKNIHKREIVVAQLLNHINDVIKPSMPMVTGIVVGGDFNTNPDQAMFGTEKTLPQLKDAGFRNGMEDLPLRARVTHPGSGRYPDATFDYVWGKGGSISKPQIVRTDASDHLPVTCDFTVGSTTATAARSGAPVTAIAPRNAVMARDVVITIPYGTTRIPAGTNVKVIRERSDSVDIDYLGSTATVRRADISDGH